MTSTAPEEKALRNSVLFENFSRLCKASLDALDKPFSPDYGTWYDRMASLLKGGPDLVAKVLERRPDLDEKKLSRVLTESEKFVRLLSEAEGTSRVSPHATTADEFRGESALILAKVHEEKERFSRRNVFGMPVAFAKHLDYVVEREYSKYEQYLYDNSVSDRIFAALYGVHCSGKVSLSDGMNIRSLEEKGEGRTMQEIFHSLAEAEEARGFGLKFYPNTLVEISPADENWQDTLRALITVIRLVRPENIGATRVYKGHANPCRPWDVLDVPLGCRWVGGPLEAIHDLTSTDIDELKSLWSVKDRLEIGYLDLSTRRFNLAYERETLEDRWVDDFISMESLFSKEGELTEVAHRLSTRVARALETGSLEGRKESRKKVKDWYDIRSKIVHGAKPRLTYGQLRELENVLRRSVMWFIRHRQFANHEKILEMLDLE